MFNMGGSRVKVTNATIQMECTWVLGASRRREHAQRRRLGSVRGLLQIGSYEFSAPFLDIAVLARRGRPGSAAAQSPRRGEQGPRVKCWPHTCTLVSCIMIQRYLVSA